MLPIEMMPLLSWPQPLQALLRGSVIEVSAYVTPEILMNLVFTFKLLGSKSDDSLSAIPLVPFDGFILLNHFEPKLLSAIQKHSGGRSVPETTTPKKRIMVRTQLGQRFRRGFISGVAKVIHSATNFIYCRRPAAIGDQAACPWHSARFSPESRGTLC